MVFSSVIPSVQLELLEDIIMKTFGCSQVYSTHLKPDNVTFSMFSTEELKKLCVAKITTPVVFDLLGHPIKGGLYDPALGPLTNKSDPCSVCCKTSLNCPGHFGYIDLPLPVVNPLFHKIIAQILRATCLKCFQIQIPSHYKELLNVFVILLDHGMVTEVNEMEILLAEVSQGREGVSNLSENFTSRIDEFFELSQKLEKSESHGEQTKSTEFIRNNFFNQLFKNIRIGKICRYCKTHLVKMQSYRGRIVKSGLVESSIKTETGGKKALVEMIQKLVTPTELKSLMRSLWEKEKDLLLQLIPVLKHINGEFPTDVFFFDIVPVPPSNTRPINVVNGKYIEHPVSVVYKSVLQTSILLRAVIQVVQGGNVEALTLDVKSMYASTPGDTPAGKLNYAWQDLQLSIDSLVDVDKNRKIKNTAKGLKQIMEKKEGVIRMHMMGKRVNFAARSVITPDPNLNIDEIGVPEEFAKKLTYPVPVTPWNVEELRKCILNGPSVHPGAVIVEDENGKIVRIKPNDKLQQQSILKRLLTPEDKAKQVFTGVKIVHRHLCNGDILMLNRQPTLHKPSIMAHKARILKGEKTLRLHYANCKAYNADFDGDEMNAHFPQNELARSEAYTIANVSNQYVVPKDGTPLSGLIQDHMISGVKLSVRGKFFSEQDYQHLVFQALAYKSGPIKLLPPSIIKPVQLWSGKQVLSTVIINTIPKGRKLINLNAKAKIRAHEWAMEYPRVWNCGTPFTNPETMSEAEVVIRSGELLCGVLDKTHYGATPYGLVHCIYELYGGTYTSKLLSSFAKLFTCFLQVEGFTLGVKDILVKLPADWKRSKLVRKSRKSGLFAATAACGLGVHTPPEEVRAKVEENCAQNSKFRTTLDKHYKLELDRFTNSINKTCLPRGLISRFPNNNLQLMVQSGAKGSTVNTMQISCLLGQIELEGRRPPVMISGRPLPSFLPYDLSPRAGGFIDGRFMTGIQPQEFFFHCMAGREGLIDTAVKTSRSGYLQRCLVKHLEGLKIGYDLTVRDSDQSVIQFLYGEDGMDVSKSQFLKGKQIEFLCQNKEAIYNEGIIENLKDKEEQKKLSLHQKAVKSWLHEHPDGKKGKRDNGFLRFCELTKLQVDIKQRDKIQKRSGRSRLTRALCELWYDCDEEVKDQFRKEILPHPDPASSTFRPDLVFGSVTESVDALIRRQKDSRLKEMLRLRCMEAVCCPGEPVGLLAAQSVGEPSTQMTLNTFHFAGRGEMNVTLGIPRLREILMTASKNPKTPSMEVPFLPHLLNLEAKAENLRKSMARVTVSDVLEKIDVEGHLVVEPSRKYCYVMRFHFLPQVVYGAEFNVTPQGILQHMEKVFFRLMFQAMAKTFKSSGGVTIVEDNKTQFKKKVDDEDEEKYIKEEKEEKEGEGQGDESSTGESEDEEDAKTTAKHLEDEEDESSEVEDEEADACPDGEYSETDGEENKTNVDVGEIEKEVISSYSQVQNYIYDKEKFSWCQLTVHLPLAYFKLDLTAILKKVAKSSVLSEVPNVKRAITYLKNDKCLTLRTDGINLAEMFKHKDLLDLNRLYCNDIHKVAETFGIEAATRVIVKEVTDVFNVYGITVDSRHLSLIADYMTFSGFFEPLNRQGMNSSASPLQQMSFESSIVYLRNALYGGKKDVLSSPSSCLMVGKPCVSGTGSFSLLHKILPS